MGMLGVQQRRHITWVRILAPYVCFGLWHAMSTIVDMSAISLGSAYPCITWDTIPQANAMNSSYESACQTNDHHAGNHNGLPRHVDAAAGILMNIIDDKQDTLNVIDSCEVVTSGVEDGCPILSCLPNLTDMQQTWKGNWVNIGFHDGSGIPWCSFAALLFDELQLLLIFRPCKTEQDKRHSE